MLLSIIANDGGDDVIVTTWCTAGTTSDMSRWGMTGRVAASIPPPPSHENSDSCTRRGVCVQSSGVCNENRI